MYNTDRKLWHLHFIYMEQKIYVGRQYKPWNGKNLGHSKNWFYINKTVSIWVAKQARPGDDFYTFYWDILEATKCHPKLSLAWWRKARISVRKLKDNSDSGVFKLCHTNNT